MFKTHKVWVVVGLAAFSAVCIFYYYNNRLDGDEPVATLLESGDKGPGRLQEAEHGFSSVRNAGRLANTPGAYVLEERVTVPEGSVVEVVEALRAQAEAGSAEAALGIYLKIRHCHTFKGSNLTHRQLQAYLEAGVLADDLVPSESEFHDCAGVESLMGEQRDWLERAAASGLLEAQLLYAADAGTVLGNDVDMLRDPERVSEYKRKAVGYLREAASRGSIDAMMNLAAAYDNGVLVDADPLYAYAYYRLVQMEMPNLVSEELINGYRLKVPVDERNKAEAVARSLRSSCCHG